MNAYERSRNVIAIPFPPRVVQAPEVDAEPPREIRVGKTTTTVPLHGKKVVAEVFTMTLGTETIPLLPLKTWSQLDTYKWRTRGILPGTPAGLEITAEHVKVGDETTTTWAPDGCERLERALNKWLALERQSLQVAAQQAAEPAREAISGKPEDTLRFQVESDAAGKPRLRCLEGRDTVKVVALNAQGLDALIKQGLMRKPQSVKIGALHNWVELDGEVFRFDKGDEGRAQFERALNEKYLPVTEPGAPPDIRVVENLASPTGFDVQFPAVPNGLVEDRLQHLTEAAIDLLSDPLKCRVLRKGIVAKFVPPSLVFKQLTSDGGETYLPAGSETLVTVTRQDGQTKSFDLSQPVSLLNLSAAEVTAIFNHPAVNRRAHAAFQASR